MPFRRELYEHVIASVFTLSVLLTFIHTVDKTTSYPSSKCFELTVAESATTARSQISAA